MSLYIRMKKKVVESVGMNFQLISLAEAVTEAELLNEIFCLNEDPSVHGILVQMPLPKHIDERNIADSLKPEKDVDAFHSLNVAKLVKNENPTFISCIPKGCIELLQISDLDGLDGKHAVVIGRSNTVGDQWHVCWSIIIALLPGATQKPKILKSTFVVEILLLLRAASRSLCKHHGSNQAQL